MGQQRRERREELPQHGLTYSSVGEYGNAIDILYPRAI